MPRNRHFASRQIHEPPLNSDQGGLQQVPFRPITEPIPEFLPWTRREQIQIGKRVGLTPEKWQWVVKHPALCLPQSKACVEWIEWTEVRENRPVGAGLVMMDESEYNGRAAKLPIPHTVKDQEKSVLVTGKPIVFYQWLTNVDEPAQGSGSP